MLTGTEYKKAIENLLNNNTYGINFKLFNDIGKYVSTLREEVCGNYGAVSSNNLISYVNGIFDLTPSELVPIANISMSTTTANIEFAVNIDKLKKEVDNDGTIIDYPFVRQIRNIWDTMAQTYTGQTISLIDSDNKNYTVILSFTLASVGIVSMLSDDTGEVLPISASVTFTVIENGVSSNNCKIYINGEQVYFNQAVYTRQRALDQVQYVNVGVNKSFATQNGIGIDLTCPLLNSSLGNTIAQDILNGGQNYIYAVCVQLGSNSQTYIMITGTTQATLQAGINVGVNLGLVECANYMRPTNDTDGWQVLGAGGEAGETYILNRTLPAKTTIMWGDTTFTILEEETTNPTHVYNETRSYTIYIKEGS